MLVGRDEERARLAAMVEAARHGSASSVLVRGEPGIGKSALLEDLVSTTTAATVLRTHGHEVEAPMAFAALHRLLRPIMRLRDQLPAPQARALAAAFGEVESPAVEPFLVGIAALSMLTSAAEEQLLLCVVDDAHWLDQATADALLFCASRLDADRAVMVFGVREGVESRVDGHGLPVMTLSGLTPEAARTLLGAAGGAVPAEEVTEHLISETGGNPLALLEIPPELTEQQLCGGSPLPDQLHLPARVEQVFLDRARRMPAHAQSMLVLIAAEDTGQVAVIERAAASQGLGRQQLDAVERSGLVVRDSMTVSVRHPLVRSALHQASAPDQRRQAHLALAAAFADLGDPDRELWHRAAAAEGPDPELATALEHVGARAQRRGAPAAAMTAFEQAGRLSQDEAHRSELTFAAARAAWGCGRAAAAQTLLGAAGDHTDDPLLLADIARLRGHIEVNVGSATLAHRIFVEAARAVHVVDPQRALEMGVLAATLRTFGADSGTRFAKQDLVFGSSVEDVPRTACLVQMFRAMSLFAEGDSAAAVDALHHAIAVADGVDDREVLWNLGNAALQLGDDAAQRHFYSAALARAREAGAVTAVVYALQRLCFSHFLAGDLVAVRSTAEEAVSLSESIGQRAMIALPTAWLALLAAIQDDDSFDGHLARLHDITSRPLGIMEDPVHDLRRWASGIHAASTGDRSAALHHLARFRLPVLSRMAAVDRLDAAIRAEEAELAHTWVDELATFAESTDRAWARAGVAFGRAIIDPSPAAEGQFQAALALHGLVDRPRERAYVQLAYGEWLRRAGRRVDARRHLRHAHEAFQDLRAPALVERAAQELRASGETARKRDPSTVLKLTPMELKVAQLVSSGMSNKDVAAQIWVSPRTVAFHLRNIFAKAGVTSRGELARLDLA